jgi:tetratricopeptide (TPR) repeat protein
MFRGFLNLKEGQEAIARCTDHVEGTHDELLRQDLYYNVSNWLLDTGEVALAKEEVERLKRRAPERQSPLEMARLAILEGEIHFAAGRPAEALRCFQQAERAGALNGTHASHNTAGQVLALLDLGRRSEALKLAEALEDISAKDRLGHNPALIATAKGRTQLRKGDPAEAIETLRRFADVSEDWMVPGHLSLRLEQFRLMKRYGMALPPRDVEAALALARDLRLPQRELQLQAVGTRREAP